MQFWLFCHEKKWKYSGIYSLFSFPWEFWMTLPHVKCSGCHSVTESSWGRLSGVIKTLCSPCVWIHVNVNICERACCCCFTWGGFYFYFCTESVREQSVFEVLCCCNIGGIQVGGALIITISLWDCSVMLPKLESGGRWPYYTLTLCWCRQPLWFQITLTWP